MALIGNIMYFIAMDLDSAIVLFVGRFLVGLGGARCVNRRYVADYISIRLRTRFSVISVACATLGTALGSIIGGLCTLIPRT